MRKALVNGRILTAAGWREAAALLIRDGRIEAIVDATDVPRDIPCEDLGVDYLLAGFIDVQVNGGGGVLLNKAESVADIERIARAHRAFGTTGLLPTLISDEREVMERAADLVAAAISQGVPGVLGIHFEGPVLNAAKRGVHSAAKLKRIDEAMRALFLRRDLGRVLVTLAPEQVTPEVINELAAGGVTVSAGHSAATFEEMQAAINAGLTGVTHLFNAMEPMTARAPGLIGAALLDPRVFCGVINDTHHVHPAMLKLALAAKGRERLMLVTDAMSVVGTGATSFPFEGETIRLEGGRLTTPGGTLAGSALDMATAVVNSIGHLGAALESAAEMASATPARFLGLAQTHGRIAPGYRADLVRMSADFRARKVWIAGE